MISLVVSKYLDGEIRSIEGYATNEATTNKRVKDLNNSTASGDSYSYTSELVEEITSSKSLEELMAEKQSLINRVSDIDKAIFTIQDAGKHLIEKQYNISRNDRDRKCKGLCQDCIIPCKSCHRGICEQCSYGYKNIVEKLKVKYSLNELNELSGICPYAILATMK